MSFISFIISQAKSSFSILIKIKLFFFFFRSSFDTSWQKYRREEAASPEREGRAGPEKDDPPWALELQVFRNAIPIVFTPASAQEGVCLYEDVFYF